MLKKINYQINKYNLLHGDRSLAVSYYSHIKLAYLLHKNFPKITSSIKTLLEQLHYIYFDRNAIVDIEHSDTLLYNYEIQNEKLVKQSFLIHKNRIHDSLIFSNEHQYLYNKFIYIITPDLSFKYYSLPLPQELLLTENRDILQYPTHPILSYEHNFSVLAAGEISFLWHETELFPSIVIVNNISGHFIPRYLQPDKLDYYIRTSLGLPDNSLVIIIVNNGFLVNKVQI